MTQTTPRLSLPFLQSSQSDKHVTVNEVLSLLDTVVQLRVASATTQAQPSSAPADGEAYILPVGATGAD